MMHPDVTVAEREIILQVVRGEKPWTELRSLGIAIQLEGGSCTIANPRGVEATADVHDLAQGMLAHLADARALREWAYVLEAGSPFLDLDVEGHPAGEILLGALWRASFGDPIPDSAIQTARQLLQTESSSP